MNRLRVLLKDWLASLKNYPGAYLVALMIAAAGVWANHVNSYSMTDNELGNALVRVVMAGVFILPLMITGSRMTQINGGKWKIIGQILTLVLGLLFYMWLPQDFGNAFRAEQDPVILSLVLARVIPFAGTAFANGGDDTRGRLKQLLFRLAIGLVSAVIVAAGISACLVSIENLFSISIDQVIYPDIWICSMALLAVSVRLSQLRNNPEDRTYRVLFRFFGLSIFLPLAGLYALILLTYGLKILATGVWPQGVVVWMVLGYMAFGVVAYVLTYPLRSQYAWLRKIHLAYFISLLLFSFLLFASIGMRVSQYGLTTERYLVIAAGVWMVIISLIALARSGVVLNAGIITFVACLALATYGPQSAVNLPIGMQHKTLVSLLETNGFLQDGYIVPRKVALDNSEGLTGDIERIYGIASYLGQVRGPEIFESLYAGTGFETLSGAASRTVGEQFMLSLGVDNIFANIVNQEPGSFSYNSLGRASLQDISDYNYFMQLPVDEKAIISYTGLSLQFSGDDKGKLLIGVGEKNYVVDLYEHRDVIRSAGKSGADTLELDGADYTLILTDLYAEQQVDGSYRIINYNGYLLLK